MLQRNSPKVQTCIASAARSRERALAAADPELKGFFLKMELSWMRLAANIAYTERVDLFLQDWPHHAAATERCLRCDGPTRLKLVDVNRDGEHRSFECLACGFEEVHSTPL